MSTLSEVGYQPDVIYGTGSGVSRCVQEGGFVSRPTGRISQFPDEEVSHECVPSSGFRVHSTLAMDTGTLASSHRSTNTSQRHPYL